MATRNKGAHSRPHPVRNPAGGAAAHGGITYQDRAAAWVAVLILAGDAAASVWGLPEGVVPSSMHCEAGSAVDDLVVRTTADGFAFRQAKRRLRSFSGDFRSAVDQCVEQYLHCRGGSDRYCPRALEPGRDRLLITTGTHPSAAIGEHLPLVLRRVRELLPDQDLDDAAHNQAERAAFRILRDQVRAAWQTATGAGPTDDELRTFLRLLNVEVLDVDPGGRDEHHAITLLGTAVVLDKSRARAAWKALVDACAQKGVLRTGANRGALRLLLVEDGIAVRAHDGAAEPRSPAQLAAIRVPAEPDKRGAPEHPEWIHLEAVATSDAGAARARVVAMIAGAERTLEWSPGGRGGPQLEWDLRRDEPVNIPLVLRPVHPTRITYTGATVLEPGVAYLTDNQFLTHGVVHALGPGLYPIAVRTRYDVGGRVASVDELFHMTIPVAVDEAIRVRALERPGPGDLPELAGVLTLVLDLRIWEPVAGGPTRGRYLSLSCTNNGPQPLRNCRVRLERLERWEPSLAAWRPPERFRPFLLVWSAHDGGGDTMTIGSRSTRACDLVCFESQQAASALLLAADDRLRPQHPVRFGTWRATCRFEADDHLPIEVETEFQWAADRDPTVGPYRTLEFTSIRQAGDRGVRDGRAAGQV